VALGVAAAPRDVPLRTLVDAGVPVALGADDPLLFGRRLTAQYEIARDAHGFTDPELAGLARASVHASAAPAEVRAHLQAAITAWETQLTKNATWSPSSARQSFPVDYRRSRPRTGLGREPLCKVCGRRR
jgi:adenosine deaminase